MAEPERDPPDAGERGRGAPAGAVAAALPDDERARLAALRDSGILDTPPEEVYDRATKLASWIAGTPIALVSLVDEDRQWFKSRVGLEPQETPRELAFCAHAILEPGELFVVDDALADPRFATNPLVTADPHIRFYAGAPLVTGAGHALGTLCVIDHRPRRLDDEQLDALRSLGELVVAQIELGAATRLLDDALDRAEQASNTRSSFLATMSHEMRTPLNAIIGLSDLLLAGDLDERGREYTTIIRDSGAQLLDQIDDIIDFTQLDTGVARLALQPTDVVAAVTEVVGALAPTAEARGLSLVTDLPPTPLVVAADPRRLRQVLSHLVGNAVKFTDEGGVVVHVERRSGDGALVEITDTGPGIFAGDHERVFDPFEQGEDTETRHHGGSGLGLTIAARLVTAMGGRIGVRSTLGEGATFWFTLDRGDGTERA